MTAKSDDHTQNPVAVCLAVRRDLHAIGWAIAETRDLLVCGRIESDAPDPRGEVSNL